MPRDVFFVACEYRREAQQREHRLAAFTAQNTAQIGRKSGENKFSGNNAKSRTAMILAQIFTFF